MTGDSNKFRWEDGAASGSDRQLVDQSLAQCQGNSMGLVGCAEFLDDVVDVEGDGALADGQCGGHFRSGFAMRRQGQNFHFARREWPFGGVGSTRVRGDRDDDGANSIAA